MVFGKKVNKNLNGILLILLISVGLSGCGSSNPTPKPAIDLSVAAQQTVSAIFTQTALARPTQPPAATEAPPAQPTAAAANETPAPPPTEGVITQAPANTGAPSAVETLGAVPHEPTREVKVEAPKTDLPIEAAHTPTIEAQMEPKQPE